MKDFEKLPGFVGNERLERAFAEDGITTPTAAQDAAFEPILLGKHVVIDSATGTGKTLAYLLPLLQKLGASGEGKVVVLSPSAELAVQILGVASRYRQESVGVAGLMSGGNMKKQQDQLQKSTRLIVGTPGRVLEVIAARKLKGVTTFVLDEPEQILASKDAAFLREVLSRPPRPQLIMAGATFGQNAADLIQSFMGDKAAQIKTEDSPLTTQISHARLRLRDGNARDLQLKRLLEKDKLRRALVYVNQPNLVRHVFRVLEEAGVSVVSVSPERTKDQCKQALRAFAEGSAEALVTTDSSAQGIDIDGVSWVIHYELPRSTQAYVHRAGRTGRAGKTGKSIVLVVDEERGVLQRLERELGITFEELRV